MVAATTAAEASRTGCEASTSPAASSATPNASQTNEYVYCSTSLVPSHGANVLPW